MIPVFMSSICDKKANSNMPKKHEFTALILPFLPKNPGEFPISSRNPFLCHHPTPKAAISHNDPNIVGFLHILLPHFVFRQHFHPGGDIMLTR